MDQMTKKNEAELTPEELNTASGGVFINKAVRIPKPSRPKIRIPEEYPQDTAETGEAGDTGNQ